MSSTTPSRGRDRTPILPRWAWALFVVLSAGVVFVVTNITQGACYDSATDDDASFCTSGPIVTVPGVWVLWGLWALFAIYCLLRVTRRSSRTV